MPFELTIDGQVYRTDDLTIEEAVALEEECDKTWLQLNPLRSAKEFQATAAMFLRRTRTKEVAAKEAAAMRVQVAQENIRWVDDNLPSEYVDGLPKVEDSPSTTTSSVSPGPLGDGPQT